ncbi:MAG: TSUP family transporter [Candidatus Micrarchaeia archaeon]
MLDIFTIFIIGLISGIITAALSIRADRFFIILLLISIAGLSSKSAVQTFFFVAFFSVILYLMVNYNNILATIKNRNYNLHLIVLIIIIFSLIGSYMFSIISDNFLRIILGIVAILYGIRILLIKINQNINLKEIYDDNFCKVFGPAISALSVSLIGTSLKPLKIPYVVNLRNIKRESAYTASIFIFFLSLTFSIIFHYTFTGIDFENTVPLAFLLFVFVTLTFEFANKILTEKIRSQIHFIIGSILLIVGTRLILISI